VSARDKVPRSAGPPWIVGHRGSPLEAPENTRASLERALDLGLDGIAYEVRASRGGELVLLADATLERTTNGSGKLAERTLAELVDLDAGGWFDARFRGEPLMTFEEALALRGAGEERRPQHVAVVNERETLDEVARSVREIGRDLSVRVASRSRDLCFEARDLGLQATYVVDAPSSDVRELARTERLAAVASGPRAWSDVAFDETWPCERWAFGVDRPEDLLEACRLPLNGVHTHEPLRALATRALVRLAPHDDGPYPIQAPELEVLPGAITSGRGDWCGAWDEVARVRNPFGFECRATVGILPRRGLFDIEKLPKSLVLAPGEEVEVPFVLTGGSWRTGGDPQIFARFAWRAGPGRRAGGITLDAPLVRVRTLRADALAQRLMLLRESPRDREASLTLRRHRRWIFVAIENAGGHPEARTIVHLDGREYVGGRGLRAPLPESFDHDARGLPFSCGFLAVRDGERFVRRWAGGVPDEIDAGAPGRLVPFSSA
jgi:hypothetical protein